jgi:hypothetical protein
MIKPKKKGHISHHISPAKNPMKNIEKPSFTRFKWVNHRSRFRLPRDTGACPLSHHQSEPWWMVVRAIRTHLDPLFGMVGPLGLGFIDLCNTADDWSFFFWEMMEIYDEKSMLYDENWPILFDDLPLYLWLMNRYRW